MDGNGANVGGEAGNGIENAGGIGGFGVVNAGGVGGVGTENAGNGGTAGTGNSVFKVCGSSENLPAKPSFWSKLKGILTYEIKVELTPYEQKIEDEINAFLHQEITWTGIKNFFFGKKNKGNQ